MTENPQTSDTEPGQDPSEGSRSSPGPVAHPHDLYFRLSLQRREEQAALVSALFPALGPLLDAEAFETDAGSYIDEGLQERQSDVLLRTRVSGRDLLIYVLVEHQRTVDGLMAFRMVRYQARIWDRHLARHRAATRLPVILPVVVYQGDRAWTAATDLRDLFDADPATAATVEEYLPQARYRLDDLTSVDMEALRARSLTSRLLVAFTVLVKAPGNAEVADLLGAELMEDLAAVYRERGGIDFIIATWTYIMSVADVAPDRLIPAATRLGQDAVEAVMTTAERLRAEGRAEGRTEGRAQGRAEGRTEGRAEGRTEGRAEGRTEGRAEGRAEGQVNTLLHLLTVKFGALPEDVVTRVRTATSGQLDSWTDRILSADTLEELLG